MAYPRSYSRLRPPKGPYDSSSKDTAVIHYSAGAGFGIDTIAEQTAALRGIQSFHMDSNGWNDIGYNFIVFQPRGLLRRARVYEGRPWHATPAAQLNHNSGTIAICVVADDRETINPITKLRIVAMLRSLKRKRGIQFLRGHRDYNSTSCPGDRLYSMLPSMRKLAGLK